MLKKILLILITLLCQNTTQKNNVKKLITDTNIGSVLYKNTIIDVKTNNASNNSVGGFRVSMFFDIELVQYTDATNRQTYSRPSSITPRGYIEYELYVIGSSGNELTQYTVARQIIFDPWRDTDDLGSPNLDNIIKMQTYDISTQETFNTFIIKWQIISNTTNGIQFNASFSGNYLYFPNKTVSLNASQTDTNAQATFGTRTVRGTETFKFSPYALPYVADLLTFEYTERLSNGKNDSYAKGYNDGYGDGERKGYEDGIQNNTGVFEKPFNFLKVIASGINSILSVKLIGNLTIGAVVTVPILLYILKFILGIFR